MINLQYTRGLISLMVAALTLPSLGLGQTEITATQVDPVVQVRLEGFANDHGLPQEFYNLLCLPYGSDPVLFEDLTQVGYLPPTRGPRCKREYEKLAYAFHKEISPHIDHEMAKRVLQTNWLPGPVLRERMTVFMLSPQ